MPIRAEEAPTGAEGPVPAGGRAGPTARWLAPTAGYVLIVGLLGVVTKVVLDEMRWSELFLWYTAVYVVVAASLVVAGKARVEVPWGRGGFTAISGLFVAASFVFIALALEHGDAGQVVPVTASYPVVTAGVAALFLSERITLVRIAGTLLVVAGVALLGME